MHSPFKKLHLSLFIAVFLFGFLLYRQIERSFAITTNVKDEPIISADAFNIPLSPSDPHLGNPGAPLTLVAFLDIGSTESRELYTTLVDFVNKHPKDARLIWKDFPRSSIWSGDNFTPHQAAYCARETGKFWPLVDALMWAKGASRIEEIAPIAYGIGVSPASFDSCMTNPATLEWAEKTRLLPFELRVSEPPALFVNNRRINVSKDLNLPQMLGSFIEE